MCSETSLVYASSPGAHEPLFVEQDRSRDDLPCAAEDGDSLASPTLRRHISLSA